MVLYSASGGAWMNPQVITMSFMPDGTSLGNGAVSNLQSTLNNNPALAGKWQQIFLQAAQTWAAQTNINIVLVPDDGAPMGGGSDQAGDPGMGDIRIGGYNVGTSALAWGYQPPPVNNFSLAGDVEFNTGPNITWNAGTTYDLASVALHEIGHSLGLNESGVRLSAMYAMYTGVKPNLNLDDITGVRSIYGGPRMPDVYGGQDTTISTSANLDSLILPGGLTGLANNLDLTTIGESEYYSVDAPAGSSGTMNVTVQSQGLSLLSPKVTVYAADMATAVATASGLGQYGTTLSVSIPNVVAGQRYYIQVQGADNTVFSTGDYSLGVGFNGAAAPTEASPVMTYANGTPLHSLGGLAQQGDPGSYETGAPPDVVGISPDNGNSNTDGITNVNRISISGIAPPSETITVYANGTALGTTTSDGGGNWMFDNTGTPLADGSYTLTATATDAAGNVSDASLPYGMIIDTATPAPPVIAGIVASTPSGDSGATTADTTPVFYGTAQPFTQVAIFQGLTLLGTTAADGNGNWNFADTTSTLQTVNLYSFTATATSIAGNGSAGSSVYYVTVIAPPNSIPSVSVSTSGVATTSLISSQNFGPAAGYAVLDEGAGDGGLQVSNADINGNIGVGGTAGAKTSGVDLTLGEIDFSAANSRQFSNSWLSLITGGAKYNVAGVASALSSVNALNAQLGAEPGTPIVINGSMTINAAAGVLDANGNRVFAVTSFKTTSHNVLTIVGDPAGDSVVLNFTQGVSFNNQVVLSGISPDQVIYNFVGGSNSSGGPSVQINNNLRGSPFNLVQGDFLDPNGPIQVSNTRLTGRIFGGGSAGIRISGGVSITTPPSVTFTAGYQILDTTDTPTFNGTATPLAQVAVLEDGTIIGVATANLFGNWTYNCAPLTSGLHKIAFQAVNAVGSFSAVAAPLTIQV